MLCIIYALNEIEPSIDLSPKSSPRSRYASISADDVGASCFYSLSLYVFKKPNGTLYPRFRDGWFGIDVAKLVDSDAQHGGFDEPRQDRRLRPIDFVLEENHKDAKRLFL